MLYRILADITVVVHIAFIVFAVFGAFLVLRWKRLAWVHVPVVVYATLIEFFSWICPLTPLENWFRAEAGTMQYTTSFTDHYIMPVIYPAGLNYHLQIVLGCFVFGWNLIIYAWIVYRGLSLRRQRRQTT